MTKGRLDIIRGFMEKHGIPGRDLYALPSSGRTFPDGAHYRMEIAGIERASTLERRSSMKPSAGRFPFTGSLQRWGGPPTAIFKN